jgi:hypothetical protein
MADLEAPSPETPPPAPEPAPETPAAPADPPPAEPDAEDLPEGAVEQAGQVMVPLAALRAERDQVKALKGKATQYDQAAQYLNQVRPYIDFLQANPDLMKRRAEPEPVAAPTVAPQDDPAAVELARTLDLYTPEGQPDAKRAARLMTTVETLAERKAQAVVKPVQQQSIQQKALSNYHEAVSSTLPNGTKVDPTVLWNVWNQSDPNHLATPQGAAAAVMMAYAMQHMQQPTPIPPPSQPPIVTEGTGSRVPNRQPMTEMDQRVANIRGISPQKYAEYAKAFRPGEVNTLED